MSTKFIPSMMNMFLVPIWAWDNIFRQNNQQNITCKLVSLFLPATEEFVSLAYITSLQCGSGKKANELSDGISLVIVPVRRK